MPNNNNPWAAEHSIWNNEEYTKWINPSFNSNFPTQSTPYPSQIEGLAKAAEDLGGDTLVMDSYWNFQDNIYNWFFSPNPKLAGSTKKPGRLKNWDDWSKFNSNIKTVIGNLAGFNKNVTDLVKNDRDFAKLQAAHKKWPAKLYGIFWSNDQHGGSWMCNVFVGDAIYMWKGKSVMQTNRHYYDPSQIVGGKGPFKKIETSGVKRGAIVVFGTTHTEIITSLKTFVFSDKGFCAIGAGRDKREKTGTIKCDYWYSDENREVVNDNNKYFTL